jgi:hypothetical protein
LVVEDAAYPANPASPYFTNRENGARDRSVVIALVIVGIIVVGVLAVFGSMRLKAAIGGDASGSPGTAQGDAEEENTAQEKAQREKAIHGRTLEYLEMKYGEKFVVVDTSARSGMSSADDDPYDLVCAPESNKEIRFSVSASTGDYEPIDYYVERLAAEDCKNLIKAEVDKIAANYAIETVLPFSNYDIDYSRWKEFITADYVVRTQQSLEAYLVIDSSSMKGLSYGEEYDILTGIVSDVLNTGVSLKLSFTDTDTVKECREYIADNQTAIYEYDTIVNDYFTRMYIERNPNGTFDPTREEYIAAREI